MRQERDVPPNESPRSALRRVACCLSVIGALVLLYAGLLIVNHLKPPPVLVIATKAKLPDGDTVAYGWISSYVSSPLVCNYVEFCSFVDWQHAGKTRRYLVRHDAPPLRPPEGTLELRSTSDYKCIWLLTTGDGRIQASLDRSTGVFLGFMAAQADPTVPLEQQWKSGVISDGGHPKWATPKGGRVLATLTEKDCDMMMRAHRR